jgi:hypothetical protein
MSSVFEHLSPKVRVTFRVNSLPPVKMTLIRPEWAKSAEDLRLVVPDTNQGRTLLAAYQWYMAGHERSECVPEPVTPVYHRDILGYLFIADQRLSLDAFFSIASPIDLQRLGEYPDLTEEELLAERDLLRKHVPDGTHVAAYVNNTTLAGIIQDGRFMAQNSQMVHSAVFVFWAGGSHGTNPYDVIWIHTTSGSEPLTDYLKKKTKPENEVVHATVTTVADEYARLCTAVRTPWATPEGVAALAQSWQKAKSTSTSTSATTSATAKATLQRPVIHPAKQTEQQDELKGLVCSPTRVQIQHNGLSMEAILEPNGTFSCGRDDDIHAAELLWRFNDRIAKLDAKDVLVTDTPLEHITYAHSPSTSVAQSLKNLYGDMPALVSAPVAPVACAVPAQTATATAPVPQTPQQLFNAARARTTELQLEIGLWKLIQAQYELNKNLETILANLKSTLVPLRI